MNWYVVRLLITLLPGITLLSVGMISGYDPVIYMGAYLTGTGTGLLVEGLIDATKGLWKE